MFNVDTVLLPLPSASVLPMAAHCHTSSKETGCHCVDPCLFWCFHIDLHHNCGDPLYSTKKKYFTEHIEYLHPILKSSC